MSRANKQFPKYIYLFHILLIVLLLPGTYLFGQKEMSLQDCIQYALDHNIDIKKQVLTVETQKKTLMQSKLGLLPTLNAGATHGYNWGQTIDRYTNQFATSRVRSNNFYVSSNFNVFSGFRDINTVKQNQMELMATNYDLDLLMDNISVTVAGYYLDILYNQELLDVARSQLEVTKLQVNRMQKLVDAGSMAKGDLLNIQAQAATEELQVVNAENTLSISYLSLQQLIDYPVSSDFKIEKPELRPIEAPEVSIRPEDVYNIAVDKRPEIKSAEQRLLSAEKGIAIARGYQSPSLSLSGSWATGYSGAAQEGVDPIQKLVPVGFTQNTGDTVLSLYNEFSSYRVIPFTDQWKKNQNKSLNLTLQIPIFNGWQVRTGINKAKIGRELASYNLQQAKLNLDKTIQQSYADAVAALKNYTASQKKVEAQQEAFKYADEKFQVGLMNSVDYNKTKSDLTTAESDLLQAKYHFIYTTTILKFYMGNDLRLE